MLTYFTDFTHQDRSDLEYGEQLEGCETLSEEDTSYKDGSITGEWTAEED